MSVEENKAIVRRFVEVIQCQHHLDAVDELFGPDFVDHSGNSNPPNREGARQLFAMMSAAFPDLDVKIQQQIGEGDKVVTMKSFHGTHQGEFMGIPATGKKIAFNAIEILRLEDGKIVEHWAVGDNLGMMQQLGVLPVMG